MRVVTSSQMKELEKASLDYDLTYARLMENAGAAAAAFIRRTFPIKDKNCIVFCGSGNNGGDGFVVARKLSENGANLIIVLTGGQPVSKESKGMLTMAEIMDLPVLTMEKHQAKLLECLPHTDIIVDAIYGTGFHGELEGMASLACSMINDAIAAVVSLDIPSGAECDTGRLATGCVRADFTVAFDSAKPVHVHEAGKEACGQLEVVEIGIPEEAYQLLAPPAPPEPESQPEPEPESEPEATSRLPAAQEDQVQRSSAAVPAAPPPEERPGYLNLNQVLSHIPPRDPQSHKGTYGTLLAVCGSASYRGAAALSTLSALCSGVGICCLASTKLVCSSVASSIYEATFLPLPQTRDGAISAAAAPELVERTRSAGAVLFGCGMENTPDTGILLDALLAKATCPVIIDADGINALAGNIMKVKDVQAPVILTPHPGEMARLTGLSIADIQEDRAGMAALFARQSGAIIVLKGHETLIAAPDGTLLRNPTGNPGLAKGGSGDVLAGIIGSFAAQGIDPLWAAACGVYLHGLAADHAAARLSQTSMLPRDLLLDLGQIFRKAGR